MKKAIVVFDISSVLLCTSIFLIMVFLFTSCGKKEPPDLSNNIHTEQTDSNSDKDEQQVIISDDENAKSPPETPSFPTRPKLIVFPVADPEAEEYAMEYIYPIIDERVVSVHVYPEVDFFAWIYTDKWISYIFPIFEQNIIMIHHEDDEFGFYGCLTVTSKVEAGLGEDGLKKHLEEKRISLEREYSDMGAVFSDTESVRVGQSEYAGLMFDFSFSIDGIVYYCKEVLWITDERLYTISMVTKEKRLEDANAVLSEVLSSFKTKAELERDG